MKLKIFLSAWSIIHCYQCNSTAAEGCLTGSCTTTNGTCIKTTTTVFGTNFIHWFFKLSYNFIFVGVQVTVKDCSPNGVHNIGCHPYTDPKTQTIMNVCSCDKRDFCNNSQVLFPTTITLLLGFVFILVG